jgi:hypothetical protein
MDLIQWYYWSGRDQQWVPVSPAAAVRQLCIMGNLVRLMSSQEAYALSHD